MSWSVAAARETFRRVYGDANDSHREFMAAATPTPDGVTKVFFVGRTRLIEDTLVVFHAGTEIEWYTEDEATGQVALTGAPTGTLQTSYYWHWWTDDEVDAFLAQGALMLGYTGVDDSAVLSELQPVVLDLAGAAAFTFKAAETAEALQASSPDGYSLDTGKAYPNWAKLADDALKRANTKFKWVMDNPLTQARPAFGWTEFRLPRYIPNR